MRDGYGVLVEMIIPYVQEFGDAEGIACTLARLLREVEASRLPCPACDAQLLISGTLDPVYEDDDE